jgi:PAS domain-containing protein
MADDDADLCVRIAEAIFETASDAVIVSDRDGTICLWSAGAERIFGFAAAEVLGPSLDIIIMIIMRDVTARFEEVRALRRQLAARTG